MGTAKTGCGHLRKVIKIWGHRHRKVVHHGCKPQVRIVLMRDAFMSSCVWSMVFLLFEACCIFENLG
jgi:hypothetical protein